LGAGGGPPGRVPAGPGHVAEQPVGPAGRSGRRDDARAASREAAGILRELAAARPDAAGRLAGSLSNLATGLASVGRPEDALAANEETVTIRRKLAAGRPDVFRPDLAKSLTNLAAVADGLRSTAQAAQAGARARDLSIVPVVPALRDSLRIAVRGRLESRKNLFNVPATVIEQLLSSSGQADTAVSMVTFSVPAEASESAAGSSVAAELLRDPGCAEQAAPSRRRR